MLALGVFVDYSEPQDGAIALTVCYKAPCSDMRMTEAR